MTDITSTIENYMYAPIDANGLAYDPSKLVSSKHSPYIGVTYDIAVDMWLGDLQVPEKYRHYISVGEKSSSIYTVMDLDPRFCAFVMMLVHDYIIENGWDAYFQLNGTRKSRAFGKTVNRPVFDFDPKGVGRVINPAERKVWQAAKRRAKPGVIENSIRSNVNKYWKMWKDNHSSIQFLTDDMMNTLVGVLNFKPTNKDIKASINEQFC